MNAKKAKAIRKALGYHPTDVRSYVATNKQDKSYLYCTTATIRNSRYGTRTAYQMLKKELAPRSCKDIRSAFTVH